MPMQIQREAAKPNPTEHGGSQQNFTQGLPITKDDVSIGKSDSNGLVQLTFSSEAFKKLNHSIRKEDLEVYTGQSQLSSKISEWNITIEEDGQVSIHMIFKDPDDISMSQDQDFVTVEVQLLGNKRIKLTSKLPPQSNEVDLRQINMDAQLMYNFVSTTLLSSFAVSFIAGQSLSLLWGLINTLQLITHTPLFSIPYTLKIFTFLKTFFYIATLDPFDSQPYLQSIFGFADSEMYPAYNDRFEFLGYDNTNFIYLLGPPMFYIFYSFLMSIVYLLIRLLPSQMKVRTWSLNKIRGQLFFNGLLCFFLETFLESGFSIVVCLLEFKLLSGSDLFNIFFAVLFKASNCLILIYLPFFLRRFIGKPESQALRLYFSELSDTLSFKNAWSVSYYSVFLARRVIYISLVFFASKFLSMQVLAFILCNLLYLVYLIGARPISQSLQTEIWNELCTLLISYTMLGFNDYVPDVQIKKHFSDSFLGLYIGNIIVNLLIVGYSSLSDLYCKFKFWLRRCRLKRLSRKQNEEKAINKMRVHHHVDKPTPELSIIKEENDHSEVEVDIGFGSPSGISKIYVNKFAYSIQQQERKFSDDNDLYSGKQEESIRSLYSQNSQSKLTEQPDMGNSTFQALHLPKSKFSMPAKINIYLRVDELNSNRKLIQDISNPETPRDSSPINKQEREEIKLSPSRFFHRQESQKSLEDQSKSWQGYESSKQKESFPKNITEELKHLNNQEKDSFPRTHMFNKLSSNIEQLPSSNSQGRKSELLITRNILEQRWLQSPNLSQQSMSPLHQDGYKQNHERRLSVSSEKIDSFQPNQNEQTPQSSAQDRIFTFTNSLQARSNNEAYARPNNTYSREFVGNTHQLLSPSHRYKTQNRKVNTKSQFYNASNQ